MRWKVNVVPSNEPGDLHLVAHILADIILRSMGLGTAAMAFHQSGWCVTLDGKATDSTDPYHEQRTSSCGIREEERR
jgi:hypothetical protein